MAEPRGDYFWPVLAVGSVCLLLAAATLHVSAPVGDSSDAHRADRPTTAAAEAAPPVFDRVEALNGSGEAALSIGRPTAPTTAATIPPAPTAPTAGLTADAVPPSTTPAALADAAAVPSHAVSPASVHSEATPPAGSQAASAGEAVGRANDLCNPLRVGNAPLPLGWSPSPVATAYSADQSRGEFPAADVPSTRALDDQPNSTARPGNGDLIDRAVPADSPSDELDSSEAAQPPEAARTPPATASPLGSGERSSAEAGKPLSPDERAAQFLPKLAYIPLRDRQSGRSGSGTPSSGPAADAVGPLPERAGEFSPSPPMPVEKQMLEPPADEPEPPAAQPPRGREAPRGQEPQDAERPKEIAPDRPSPPPSPSPSDSLGGIVWPEPKALLAEVESLGQASAARSWAKSVQQALGGLPAAAAQPQAMLSLCDQLDQLALDAAGLAGQVDDRNLARRLRQAGYALTRRADVWRHAVSANRLPADPAENVAEIRGRIDAALQKVESLLPNTAEGRPWRSYLLIDSLRASLSRGLPTAPLVAEYRRRIAGAQLTPEQRALIDGSTVASLTSALALLDAQPADVSQVLRSIEEFELSPRQAEARAVAAGCRALADSPLPGQRQLARRIEVHYRNANLRFAISEKLLNRMLPARPPETAAVNEVVQGVPTVGQSVITSDVAVRLLPDPTRVRMALEINGEVSSFTASNAGPATFYNRGNTIYTARKNIELDLDGVRAEPTQINVHSNSRLQGLETNLDGVPLLGAIASRVAVQQHEQHKPAAERELRWKIARKARQKIDAETTAQFEQATNRLQEKLVRPMEAIQLRPTLISAETTAERIAMRLRLAGDDQLGSHTARPQAPADSLASLQVHESALNNALSRLELDGRTFTLPELRQHLSAKLNRLDVIDEDRDNDDVQISFAPQNALYVSLNEGQLGIHLSIAKLSKPPRVWRDFQVHAYYKPQLNGRTAELVRDGIIHLAGTRLNTGGQIALRSVFSKTFSRNSTWTITPDTLLQPEALSDLEITQCAIDDGWLGVALGPKRTAHSLRNYLLRR